MNPLVSIMIPYYNDEKFLAESISSVLNQSYSNLELILINHASTDGSRDIARSYSDNRIVHIDVSTNYLAGGYHILQAFIEKAKGTYLKLFCADDVLHIDAITILVNHLETNPDVDVVFGNMQYIDENSNKKMVTTFPSKDKSMTSALPRALKKADKTEILQMLSTAITPFAYPTVLFKKLITKKLTLDPTLVFLFDVQIWTYFAVQGYSLDYIDSIICYYRQHGEQMSVHNNNDASTQFEHLLFNNIFFTIKDPNIIKIICFDSPYVNLIDSVDKELFPFIICHRFLYKTQLISDKVLSFIKISEMLSSDTLRKNIEKTFSFSIKDLRKLYLKEGLSLCFEQTEKFDDRNISFKRLVFLLARKIAKKILKLFRN